jgi:hypothetical protein
LYVSRLAGIAPIPTLPPPKSLVKREPFAYHARMAKRVAKFPEVFAVRLEEGSLRRFRDAMPPGMSRAEWRRLVVDFGLRAMERVAHERRKMEKGTK